ncbi:hypothetical protein [Prauserella muralis]|uniref:Uncharacterized protein n=1 Tax=Prauserella muralis TaxID=588067 RepID=A0A2V4AJA8_9PSEU|nr:hypothetical protein [Prauserella muralis]PXY18933.1 hypothetical protein BAY60_29315 [Prauserella muralis]TWE28811.1 hypothetical protein FHX69_1475 [Prauserella muralis]
MRPTIVEQLEGAQRLLDLVRADENLSPASRDRLRDVGRLLTHVHRSCTGLPAFLAEDNARLAVLLGEAEPPVEFEGLIGRNDELRASLARTIRELGERDTDAWERIWRYLRWRVETDPS